MQSRACELGVIERKQRFEITDVSSILQPRPTFFLHGPNALPSAGSNLIAHRCTVE
jgi:hypothetical protein